MKLKMAVRKTLRIIFRVFVFELKGDAQNIFKNSEGWFVPVTLKFSGNIDTKGMTAIDHMNLNATLEVARMKRDFE